MTNPLRSGDVVEVRVDARPARDGSGAPDAAPARAYPYRQPLTWFLRRRGYLLYIVRELTALPIAIWMVLLLVEIARLHQGAGGYQPLGGPVFIAVSAVCLVFALWHSFTFLNLAGLIMRIPLGDRNVSPRVIVGAAFSGFLLLTVVVGGLLIWGGM